MHSKILVAGATVHHIISLRQSVPALYSVSSLAPQLLAFMDLG